MFRIKIMIILSFIGCGQVTLPSTDDAAQAADAAQDAMDAMNPPDAVVADSQPAQVTGCPDLVPFELSWGTPVIMSVSSVQDRDLWPSLACDDTEIYFTRVLGGSGQQLFVSRRANRGEPWSVAEAVGAGGTVARDPEIAPGGMELYYNSETDLRMLHRNAVDQPWQDTPDSIRGRSPALSGDGLTLYYIDAWNAYQLMRRQRTALDSNWSQPEAVRVPNDWRYQQVSVSPDGTTLLLFRPLDLGNPTVVAVRDSTWMELPELASVSDCDFSWHGDLVCHDNDDLLYVPNSM